MSESKLRALSTGFSVDIIELVKYLKSIKESIISNQIGRSGTSDEQTFKMLSSKCTSLRAMLIASCKTAKDGIR